MIIKYRFYNLEREDYFIKLRNKYPSDDEIERTEEFIIIFKFENGENLTKFYCKSDVILLADIFDKFKKCQLKNLILILFIVLVYC